MPLCIADLTLPKKNSRKESTMDYHGAGQVLLVDKPLGRTSFYVVMRIRKAISMASGKRKVKVGHAGTLDPLATGLLIICTGKKTKSIADYQGMDKMYSGTIRIGCTTPSFDAETEPTDPVSLHGVTREKIEAAARELTGEITQVPPLFSAVKIDGKRAYKLARKGSDAEPEPRQVRIARFDITGWEGDSVSFEIECSKGTYIRSMARDFGAMLGVGGYLTSLRRESIGTYQVADALDLEHITEKIAATADRADEI